MTTITTQGPGDRAAGWMPFADTEPADPIEFTDGQIDDRVAQMQAEADDGELAMSLYDDADATALANAVLAAHVRGKPELAAKIGRFLMLRAMKMPAAREAARQALIEEATDGDADGSAVVGDGRSAGAVRGGARS